MLLDTDEGGCLRALAKNAYDTAIEQRMASAAAAAQSKDRDDASPEPDLLQGRPPPQRRRRLQPAPKAKAKAKAAAKERDVCGGGGGDGPCVRVRELFGSEGSREAVLPPGLRLTLHSAPPTKAEARVARRLRREEREANQWNRKAAVRRMADVDVVALVATLDGCSPAQACTPSPSRAAAGAPPAPTSAAACAAAESGGHSCLDLSQLSFRKLRDALGSRRRVRGRGSTGGVGGGGGGCGGGGVPGCGTRIAPSVRVAAMIERRCGSAPPGHRPTAAPPSPSPQQPLPQEMQPLPQPAADDGGGGSGGGGGDRDGNTAAPADDEARVLPAAYLPGTPPLAAKKPPMPPPPPPSASDGDGAVEEAPSPAAESETVADAASGDGGGGAARSALHESPEERRERERQQMHAAQQARVYGVGEFQRLPLPLETWVPAADLPRTAARLGSVGSDLKQDMEERRAAGLQRLRQLPGKPYRIPPRTTVLGVTCVAEWRLMNRKLVGAAADATEVLCNKGAPPLTENERLKMPLPQHLAYRTKGGLRNC